MSAETVRQEFLDRYGEEPELLAVAPGRINLIGEHTDYNDGFVFPAAIDRQVWIAASRSEDEKTRLYSLELEKGQSFDADDVPIGTVDEWAAYPAGMAWALKDEGFDHIPNINAVIHGEVPIGSGISSSAALELAFGVAWNEIGQLALSNQELAKIGQKCENRFVGVASGIMDQMASAMGKQDHALFLDTRSLEIRYAPLPTELSIVVCDTEKPRALTDSAYNERRSQCEAAAKILGVKALRDANLDQLEAAKGSMDEVVYRRARHVITENQRCLEYVDALAECDREKIGQLMKASHLSLKDDYEVSSTELDAMAEAAWASPGCVGARMTGAGFGGACVALVDNNNVNNFVESASTRYNSWTNRSGDFLICRAVDGARRL